jgi:predicted RNA binding protein YcfA (HicA-like mRNA interferase family)
MSPELRGIKATEAIKAFERAGGIRKSGKGDHVNVKMPNMAELLLFAAKER